MFKLLSAQIRDYRKYTTMSDYHSLLHALNIFTFNEDTESITMRNVYLLRMGNRIAVHRGNVKDAGLIHVGWVTQTELRDWVTENIIDKRSTYAKEIPSYVHILDFDRVVRDLARELIKT